MDASFLDTLPPLYRLALAYAPAIVRDQWLTLLALDARLASVLRQARDPVLGQIRFAWWRERLLQPPGERPKGEPLLAGLAGWPEAGAGLVPLVDGWEALLGEGPLDAASLVQFADGRRAALEVLARLLGADGCEADRRAARWSFADLACHFGLAEERNLAVRLHAEAGEPRAIDRRLRPLVVLECVTSRAMGRGGASALTTPGAFFTAVRAGLLGR